MANNSLRIVTLNINGIQSEHYTLQDFLHREDIDIILLQETKKPPWLQWNIPGYVIHHTPGPVRGQGGTAVILKTSIIHTEVELPQFTHLQTTAIEAKLNNRNTLIASVYAPPTRRLLPNDLTSLTSVKDHFIIGQHRN